MRILKTSTFLAACILIFGTCTSIKTYNSDRSLVKLTSDIYVTSEKVSAYQSSGIQLYKKYCLTCHQADGSGVPGMFPPLARNGKITGPSIDLIRIVLFGLEGPIVINGKDYDQTMPAQDYLSDQQIAAILSYIRNTWGNKASVITQEEVRKIRKLGKAKKI